MHEQAGHHGARWRNLDRNRIRDRPPVLPAIVAPVQQVAALRTGDLLLIEESGIEPVLKHPAPNEDRVDQGTSYGARRFPGGALILRGVQAGLVRAAGLAVAAGKDALWIGR